MNLQDSIFLRSLKRLPVSRTPIWIMRQAGRYLPEYRQTREKAGSFMALCKNPELACEVTLQPLRRFNLDAAILFSDILTIPDAMGLGLNFVEGEGPQFSRPLREVTQIENLPQIDVSLSLSYVMDAVRLIRQEMPKDLPLIGFSGSPWTLACYMIEGESSRDFKHALNFMYTAPEVVHHLLQTLSKTIIDYLDQQVCAGANALMLFDTWGGILSTRHFQLFSADYLKFIVASLKAKHPEIPVIVFTKGGGQWLPQLVSTGCDALGLDWTCDLTAARKQVSDKVALQGNLDPAILRASPHCIREQVKDVLEAYGQGNGHIFNLGHGITPDIPPENVKVLVDAVHEFSVDYH